MLCTANLPQTARRPPAVETPLGTVGYSVVLGSEQPAGSPNTVWRLPSGSLLHRWRHRTATVDLLLGRIAGDRPHVRQWAALWQVHARRHLSGLGISVELAQVPTGVAGGPDSGQYLAAVSAQNDQFMVSIGGPDQELLAAQAEEGRLVPARWGELLPAEGDAIEYGRDSKSFGLGWNLPGLNATETAQLCVTTAWCRREHEPAAWFAVTVPVETAYRLLTADPA